MVIVVTGPESTGKTFLARYLAQFYKGTMVGEYAREYLDLNGPGYDINTLSKIAEMQQERILAAMKSGKLVICDTDVLTIHIWKEQKFKVSDKTLLDRIQKIPVTAYLVCSPDMLWEPDPLRENPNDRELLFGIYIKYISSLHKTYSIVSGTPIERCTKARYFIDGLLK